MHFDKINNNLLAGYTLLLYHPQQKQKATEWLTGYYLGRREKNYGEEARCEWGCSMTRLGNLLDFGQLFKAFGNN